MGKTCIASKCWPWSQKHPHGCGEDYVGVYANSVSAETPPRVWGRRVNERPLCKQAGNTPTGVGKTQKMHSHSTMARKHPHGCGEDVVTFSGITMPPETPPRVWGRRTHTGVNGLVDGNTPTGVGKTPAQQGAAASTQKHPHGCGEDSWPSKAHCSKPETPPRVWGRPPASCRPWCASRNTPTGVGKTVLQHGKRQAQRKHPHGCGEDKWQPPFLSRCLETPPRVWGRPATLPPDSAALGNTPTGVGKTRARPITR